MQDKEIKEGNKLIAEFMGGHISVIPKGGMYGYKEGTELWRSVFTSNPDPINSLEFDNDFGWLMLVVEKIEKLYFKITISLNDCIIERTSYFNNLPKSIYYYSTHSETKIQSTFKAIVRFIIWYNQNQLLCKTNNQ